jgi:ferrous iron transport protein A
MQVAVSPPAAAGVPLSAVEQNVPVRLVSVATGRGLASHLAAMGIRRGSRLVVLRSSRPGPLIIGLDGVRLALGMGIADRLTVVPLDDPEKN